MTIKPKDVQRYVSEQSGVTMVVIEKVLDAYYDVLHDIVMSGNKVRLGNIGTLENSAIKSVDEITIKGGMFGDQVIPAQPEHNRPKFSFAAKFTKEMRNKTLGNQFPR